jgi:Bacterial Ig-like domain (group 3)
MNVKRWIAMAAAVALVPLAGVVSSAQPALAVGTPTVTTVSSPTNPSTACGSVTFTATVHGAFFPDSPEGFVQFFDGASLLGGPQLITPDFDEDPIFGTHTIPTNHSSANISVSLSGGSHVITAAYAGTDVPSLSDPLVQTVTAATSTTKVTSSINPTVFGQATVLVATVSSACSSSVAGSVQFQADGADLGAAQAVDGSGHAALTESALVVGDHPVAAVFSSSTSDVVGSSGSLSGGQVVTPAATATSVTSSDNPSEFGAPVNFTSTTTVTPPGAGTPTGTVQFQDNGANLGSSQGVSSSGHTSVTTAGLSVGNHLIAATYSSGSANFDGSSGSVAQTVNKARTTVTYDGDTTADYHDPAAVSARLTRTDNSAPISGKLLTLSMGAETCSQATDANGVAACTITPSEAAGPFTITAAFAGDGDYLSSSGSASFIVTREETTTSYTGPTVIAQGQPVTLSGLLREDGTVPISGRQLTLTLGSGASGQSCTAATDPSGAAHCTVPNVSVAQGPEPVTAAFAGDGYYLPSADASHSAIVFAFPSRGVFLLGDTTVAANPPKVTFWGAQWAGQNALTGGDAPASFKGFADNPGSNPPSCKATWTSSPGNSSSPDASVPAYMGTAVSSSITKHGSQITGVITKIVVVVTDPGFAANPGHPGTGAIVATYCG